VLPVICACKQESCHVLEVMPSYGFKLGSDRASEREKASRQVAGFARGRKEGGHKKLRFGGAAEGRERNWFESGSPCFGDCADVPAGGDARRNVSRIHAHGEASHIMSGLSGKNLFSYAMGNDFCGRHSRRQRHAVHHASIAFLHPLAVVSESMSTFVLVGPNRFDGALSKPGSLGDVCQDRFKSAMGTGIQGLLLEDSSSGRGSRWRRRGTTGQRCLPPRSLPPSSLPLRSTGSGGNELALSPPDRSFTRRQRKPARDWRYRGQK